MPVRAVWWCKPEDRSERSPREHQTTVRRNGTVFPRPSARNHVPALIFFSFLFLDNTLPATTQDENDLRVPITFFPALTAPLLSYLLSSSIALVLHSGFRTTSYRHKAATTRQSYALVFIPF
jgi:hypothetical protein